MREGEQDMAKSRGKGAISLWFEFLKRAHAANPQKINHVFYKQWGNYAEQTFADWWNECGESIFPKSRVEIAKGNSKSADAIKVSVPLNLTPTDAANQVRELLIEHYKLIGHSPSSKHLFALTEGVEIRVVAFKAYLHTYDIHQKLLATKKHDEAVPAKELLAAVRCFYLARTHRWRNTKRRVGGLPMALAGDFVYNSESNTVTSPKHDETAIRSIRRYLLIAQKLVENAAKGDFPSADYYK